jgi:uncharacterized RmlC-like cupin family protein
MADAPWKHDGVRVVPADKLDPDTSQTPGMDRQAAITFARTGAQKCVLVRSDGQAVAVDLDTEPAEPPEDVAWVDPTHPAP